MKIPRLALLIPLALGAGPAAWAQSVQFVLVQKAQDFDQTGPSTVIADPSQPFQFDAQVTGTGLTSGFPGTPNQITSIPAGSGATGQVPINLNAPGSTDFNSSQWTINSTFSSQASLDAQFADGAYSLSIGGQTINLSLTGDLYPNAPVIAASANGSATWLPNGTLLYNTGQSDALTLTTNAFSTNFPGTSPTPAQQSHLGFSVIGQDGQPDLLQLDSFDTSSVSETISASSFVVGTTYQVQVDFDRIVTGPLPLSGELAGGEAAAIYTANTSFDIEVIPEPATEAWWAGAGALALAVWLRRRADAGSKLIPVS
jgi:hypothetical protein